MLLLTELIVKISKLQSYEFNPTKSNALIYQTNKNNLLIFKTNCVSKCIQE